MIMLQLSAFPVGIFDWKELWAQPRIRPGRGWQHYSSLGVLERTRCGAEGCHSSKIV